MQVFAVIQLEQGVFRWWYVAVANLTSNFRWIVCEHLAAFYVLGGCVVYGRHFSAGPYWNVRTGRHAVHLRHRHLTSGTVCCASHVDHSCTISVLHFVVALHAHQAIGSHRIRYHVEVIPLARDGFQAIAKGCRKNQGVGVVC